MVLLLRETGEKIVIWDLRGRGGAVLWIQYYFFPDSDPALTLIFYSDTASVLISDPDSRFGSRLLMKKN